MTTQYTINYRTGDTLTLTSDDFVNTTTALAQDQVNHLEKQLEMIKNRLNNPTPENMLDYMQRFENEYADVKEVIL